jgi:hypothetical protein
MSTGSTLAWLDYSESERRRMLEAVELFRDRDTVDELGLGSVRDAFSDLLFPGTSVLHTRARYLLLIPWVYLELERRKVASAQVASLGRRDEVRLIEALKRGEPGGQGIIGVQAGARLQRLPSSAYWQGLNRLGIRLFAGSQDRYHRSLDAYYVARRRFRDLQQSVQGEDSELDERQPSNWHPAIPPAPDGLYDAVSFELEPGEAAYLRDRILLQAPGTLLAALIERTDTLVGVTHPWLHAAYAELDTALKERVDNAHLFSNLMHGGQLLYGHMLAELIGSDGASTYGDRLSEWEASRERLAERAASTDRNRFWTVVRDGNPGVPHPTQRFIDRWWDLVVNDPTPVAESPAARTLITERELLLKRGLARLDEANRHAREMWGGSAGLNQLDYRWATVRQLLEDIHTGLATHAGT